MFPNHGENSGNPYRPPAYESDEKLAVRPQNQRRKSLALAGTVYAWTVILVAIPPALQAFPLTIRILLSIGSILALVTSVLCTRGLTRLLVTPAIIMNVWLLVVVWTLPMR